MMTNNILLTATEVKEWHAEKEAAETRIAADQELVACLERRLQAVSILTGDGIALRAEQSLEPSATRTTAPEISMPKALIAIVTEKGGPMANDEARQRLRDLGFPGSRLGNYYYTVAKRVTDRGDLIRVGKMLAPPARVTPTRSTEGPNEHASDPSMLNLEVNRKVGGT